MEKNAFDASAVVLELWLVADLGNAPPPGPETRSTSSTLSHIGREANFLFKAVDVLGVVPNQLASIAQVTDEMVCSCRIGGLSKLTQAGDVLVEERPSFRIIENRRMEKTTAV